MKSISAAPTPIAMPREKRSLKPCVITAALIGPTGALVRKPIMAPKIRARIIRDNLSRVATACGEKRYNGEQFRKCYVGGQEKTMRMDSNIIIPLLFPSPNPRE